MTKIALTPRCHMKLCDIKAILKFFWVLVLLRFREEIRLFQKIEFTPRCHWKTEWFFIHFIKNHREISSKTLNLYMNLGSKRLELWKKDLKMLWNCLLKKKTLAKLQKNGRLCGVSTPRSFCPNEYLRKIKIIYEKNS